MFVIELTDPSGNFSLVKSSSRRNSIFEDGVIVFYEKE